MLDGSLIRINSIEDQGIIGVLNINSFFCFTIELNWNNNERDISCIPCGKYQVVPRESKKFRKHFHVLNVPNRSFILIHPGNFAGNINAGYISNTHGCILVGDKIGEINGQICVLNSRNTLRKMVNLFKDGFTLNIREVF